MNRIMLTLLAVLLLCSSDAVANTIQYSYDDAGRLAAVSYGGEKSITYGYDVNGNLVTYKAGGGVKRGDVNMDGDVNLIDALVALRLLSGLAISGVDLAGYLDSQQDVLFLLGLSEVIYILRDLAEPR